MSELRTIELGDVAIREGTDGRRTVSGYAYRWGELSIAGTREAGGLQEGYEKGAFTVSDRVAPYLDTHYSRGGRSVGGITFVQDDVGLRYEGTLHASGRAAEYAAELDGMGGSGSVSLEVMIDTAKSVRKGGAVIHHSARPVALAGVPYGAFEGATVAIREVQQVEQEVAVGERTAVVEAGPIALTREQTIEIATRAAEEVARTIAERSGNAAAAPHALAGFKSLGEMMIAANKGDAPRDFVALSIELAERALDDVVTTAGVNAALLTGNLTVREVAGIVSRGRPAITAFGGPRPIQDTGLSVTWPYFDGTLTDFVAAQSAQKAEITSSPVDIKLGTEALVTYAGGADIAYQLIRQGDPSILDIFGRIVLTAWGVVTDAAFVTELESGSVTFDMAEALSATDFAENVSDAIDISIVVETATGQPAEFVLASSTAFAHIAKLVAASSTQVVTNGTLDLRSLRLAIGNLPLIHVPSITAGKLIVSNQLAAGWHEAGPFLATAEDVAKLGRNVAYWSMGAGARYIPAGIVEWYDVTP